MHFKDFHFVLSLTEAVTRCGYTTPTPIQQQTIPHLLQGENVLGLAQTGTGKTAAYLLPTLQRLLTRPGKGIRALILVPTRELAEQVYATTLQLTKSTPLRSCTVFGGVSKSGQIQKISRGVDIVIACPGRLLDHINAKIVDLTTLDVLILDEADQMCDQGFLPDLRRILKHVPANRQSMLFSATMPDEIRGFVREILVNPVTIQIDHDKPATSISHTLFQVAQDKKPVLLRELLQSKNMQTALIFTRTKYKAKNLGIQLQRHGFAAASLQGNMSQTQRKAAMDGFRNGKFTILVATDIAARGIDVSGISHVINYDVPDTVEAYTHRVGRTGRAQAAGQAFTLATGEDQKIIRMIEGRLGKIFSLETMEACKQADAVVSRQPHGGKPSAKAKKKHTAAPAHGGKQHYGRKSAAFDFGLAPRHHGRGQQKTQTAAK